MEYNRLQELIQKYNKGQLKNEEVIELNNWFHSLHIEGPDFEKWVQETGGEEQFADGMLLEFNARLQENKTAPFPKLKWFAAAASILLCLGIAVFLFNGRNRQSHLVAASKPTSKTDVNPGSNKAVLTLSNGQQIVLDPSVNGQLAIQGTAAINHNKNGSLVYSSSSGTKENPAPVYNTLSTPQGGQYMLVLSDGTKVWLNAASSIRYPASFNGNERKVEITGEAYFEVVHNDLKPFKVTSNGQVIEDIGTHFNINAYNDEPIIKTTLVEGKVRVVKNGNHMVLSPGQQCKVSRLHDKIELADRVDTTAVVAWKNGLFKFHGASIEEVMRQLSRWYNVGIVYKGDVSDRKFSGEITRNVKLSEVLEILSFLHLNFTVDQKGGQTFITVTA